MTAPVRLPDGLRVFERGWLSANNILLDDGDGATLIDSGYLSHAGQTVALLRAGLGDKPLTRLINTHSHSDHIGGNAALRRAFGCEITVPAGMFDAVQRWDEEALLLSVAAQHGERFSADHALAAGESFVAGGLQWQALAAPGHDMDALVFHNPEHRVLISGDALWRDGFGILFADVLGSGDGLGEARRTLEAIARLPVEVVIPGHGSPFVEFDDALERAFGRIRAFEQDGARIARNAMRACVTFTLLERRAMTVDELAGQLAEVPLYRIANTRFLGLSVDALTIWLVDELLRAGVARREGERLLAR
ncbi:MBL fold metallo-hydrolase [Pseudothauera nasutitermitis]|uniref:beta-lactamase n=1 Tax=Pseudothauera nasutitermitis TaxID=2565930 RepID=A0A4S4AVN7_9RHOO|nr:MBL fold metallo-hydrolase [Pseudothauera nasutitermitis]THF64018.1 MBL fold metallo-hydrolase [Pseudothauera nasutitermitis]